MITYFCFISMCLIPLFSNVVEGMDRNPHASCLEENSEVLKTATERYLNFINKLGRGESFPQLELAAESLSPDCKKILNGQIFTRNREEFVWDLLSVYESQGAWQVCPKDIIIDSSGNRVVLRLFIEMEKWGTYTAIVILRYDSNYLITEINEVLNQVKGSYDFNM